MSGNADNNGTEKFEISYFKVVDQGADPQLAAENPVQDGEAYVYATIKKTFEKEEMDKLNLINAQQ